MSCDEARDILEEYRRGELPPDAVVSLEAHLAGCPRCRRLRETHDAVAALVRRMPRTPAPPSLRRRILEAAGEQRRRLAWLRRPWAAAALAAATVALILAPWLQFRSDGPTDPFERLLQAGVAEHARILLQLQGLAAEVSDPASAFARVRSLTDIDIPQVFAGDEELTLMSARPTMIANRKVAAVVLRDRAWFITTYFAVHGNDLPMPERGRVQIEKYKPYMRQINGFNVIYWKQGEYAYLMVSDLDAPRCRQLFLKMRKAL